MNAEIPKMHESREPDKVPESVVPSSGVEWMDLQVLPTAPLRVNTPCLSSMSTWTCKTHKVHLNITYVNIIYWVTITCLL